MARELRAGDRVVFVDDTEETMEQALDEVGGPAEDWPLAGDTGEVLINDPIVGHIEVRFDVRRSSCRSWWVLTRQLQLLNDGGE